MARDVQITFDWAGPAGRAAGISAVQIGDHDRACERQPQASPEEGEACGIAERTTA